MLGLRSPGSLLFPRCGGNVRGGVVACSASDRQVRYYSQGMGGGRERWRGSVLGLRSPGSLLFPRCGGDVRGGVVACSASDRQVRYYSPGVGVT